MRAVLLLLLLGALAWGFLRVYPGGEEPEVEAAGDDAGHFLTGDPVGSPPGPLFGTPAVAQEAASPPATVVERPTLPPAESPRRPSAGASPFAPSASAPEAVELAALVLHADPGAVARFAETRLAAERRDSGRAACAFAEARAGRLERAREIAGDVEALELHRDERWFLAQALGEERNAPAGAMLATSTPLALAMSMALVERRAEQAFSQALWPDAARGFSRLMLQEVEAPWEASRVLLRRWTDRLTLAQEQYRWNPRADWPRVEVRVQPGDSLTVIRKRVLEERPGLSICTGLIERASGYGPDQVLHPGDLLLVPTDPVSTRVDLSSRWLFFLFGDEVAAAWEVAIGAPESPTTPGLYEAGEKQENPTWFPQGRPPILFGDPANPLGTRWISWNPVDGGGRGLGFHGTWQPETVGQSVSDGCIRLPNADVEELFRVLPKGTPISVRP